MKYLILSDIREGARILDVSTGTGVKIPFLVSRTGTTGEVTAVDLDEKMIGIARNKYNYTNVKFTVGDIF